MAFSIKHVTTFRYHPAVGESVMEVRMQPRSDLRQRCMMFSLDVVPAASVIPTTIFWATRCITSIFRALQPDRGDRTRDLDINPAAWPAVHYGTWEDLDTRVAEGITGRMLLPSHYAKPTELLMELFAELKLVRRASPLELLLDLNQSLYDKFDYAPNTTKVDSPIDDALRARRGVCQDFAHIMMPGAAIEDSMPLCQRLPVSR